MEATTSQHHNLDQWVVAWCNLTRRMRNWQDRLEEALRPRAMAMAELLVLWRTGRSAPPGISQIDLARELNISAAQVCGLVDTLQSRSWLQTVRPREDRRRLYCSLTPLGKATLDQLVEELTPMAEVCLNDVTPDHARSLAVRAGKEAA